MDSIDSLFWTNATRIHDWRTLLMPLRILDTWIALGLVSEASWIEPGNSRRRKITLASEQIAEIFRKQTPSRGDSISLRLGGTRPFEWAITALIFPRAQGMSLFNLRVMCHDLAILPSSNRMMEAFLNLYSPELADAAMLHTDPQWSRLAAGPYKPPLVTTPSFAGVFWANFIGPGHLKDFSIQQLKTVDAYRTRWCNDQGMFLIASESLEDSTTPDGEEELLRLTAAFRSARK